MCATYSGHLHFVELSDRWGHITVERLDNDKTALVVRQPKFATLTIFQIDN